jgi:uncharacterized membrane protein (UPF0127 family)
VSLPYIALQTPRTEIRVQVAKTPAEREHGLMGVTKLPAHTGMLFIFDQDAPVAFWMKDTLIPLDMVFIGPDGIVRRVYANVPVVARTLPDSEIPLEQGTAKYVIELPAGEAAKDGLREGARVRPLP